MTKPLRLVLILLVLLALMAGAIFAGLHLLYPQKYAEQVAALAAEFDVDESLIFAVISCESGFDPDARSDAGALGLMQLTPDAFDWVQRKLDGDVTMESDALFDPEVNLRYGVALLDLHLTEFGTPEEAMAAYHAGRGRVNGWLANPEVSSDGVTLDTIPYADTAAYVKKVMQTWRIYEFLYS